MKILPFALAITALSCRTAGKNTTTSLASLADVKATLGQLTGDGLLDKGDVEKLFEAAGDSIDATEGMAIYRAIRQPQGYTVAPDAVAAAEALALNRSLKVDEQDLLKVNKTLAGTTIPEAVKKVLIEARLAGATAYDVRDPDPDSPDEGFWSPYPQSLPPIATMAFKYTEITPATFEADLADTSEFDVIAGQDVDGSVTYKRDKCLNGRGRIVADYDELFHPKIYARGRSCQKWANNCAILMDGSFHCLPASRRMSTEGDLAGLILTNPSLAREKHMLFNGHIEAQNGVITSIGMSGRIGKKAARNQFAFVDPVALFKAWGFKLAPNLKTRTEHGETANLFRVDAATGTVRGPDVP